MLREIDNQGQRVDEENAKVRRMPWWVVCVTDGSSARGLR